MLMEPLNGMVLSIDFVVIDERANAEWSVMN